MTMGLPENKSVEVEDAWGIMYRPREDIDADELIVRSPMWFANVMILHEQMLGDLTDIRTETEAEARKHIVDHILNDPTVKPHVTLREERAYRSGLHGNHQNEYDGYLQRPPVESPNGWFTTDELRTLYKMVGTYVPTNAFPNKFASIMSRLEKILSIDKQYYEI